MTCYFVHFVIQNYLGNLEAKCDTVTGAGNLNETDIFNLLVKNGWSEIEYVTSYEMWE